ncbi:MAG: hypothetical protein V1847_02015 [Candidatus Diapherotrites archaeon]
MKAWQTGLLALVVTYVVLFFFQLLDSSSFIFGQWIVGGRINPAFFFAPIAGFAIAYYATKYSEQAMELKIAKGFLFPVLWIAGCVLAFYIAVAAYQYNNYIFQTGNAGTAIASAFGAAGSIFWNDFSKNPFFLFTLAGIAGWIAHWLNDRA